MRPVAIQEACAIFARARRNVDTIDELPAHCRPQDIDEAYEIQKAFIQQWPDDVVGWKVGATNLSALALFGAEEPFLGPIFAQTVFESPVKLASTRFQHYCLESEFAFRIGSPPPGRAELYGHDELLGAVSEVVPALELICPRSNGIPKGDGAAAIADCGVGGGLVLGRPVRVPSSID